MILILNGILILTKTLRNDTKFGGYLYYIKNEFQSEILILVMILIRILKKNEKSLRNKTKFHKYRNI